MAKKDEHPIRDFVLKEVLSKLSFNIKKAFDNVLSSVNRTVKRTVNYSIKKVLILSLVILGLVFMLVGVGQFMDTILPEGVGYIIIGLVILIIGLMSNIFTKR